jgi:hypothetical protein
MSTNEEDIRLLEDRRWAAMIAADVEQLRELLSDELSWTHASGHCEGKPAFLERIASRSVTYLEIVLSNERQIHRPGITIITGLAEMSVVLNGRQCELRNRYTNVWIFEHGSWRMAAWHSTPADSVR